jgi:protein-ribulosamine 3-kinase
MTNLPEALKKKLEEHLMQRIIGFSPASGGCINHGGQLTTTSATYFVKWNNASRYPEMFEKESKGLALLQSTCCIDIPRVVWTNETASLQFIVLDFIQSGSRCKNYWALLGEQLACLHQHSHGAFGLDHDNYIGSLPQRNKFRNTWADFFMNQRITPQLRLAVDAFLLAPAEVQAFERLAEKLPSLFPDEKPALLHGDLWSGNLMVNAAGEPCLIDPAVYYGHREAELAFTQLFGGFDSVFYEAYHASFPLQPGFDERADLYNLYPLLVHVNLFGGGYATQVKRILSQWV